jgi:ribosomal protein S18 acetylase RimI-like enzyme
MVSDICIRKIGLNELEQLQHISRETFTETFAGTSDPANLEKYLTEAYAAAKLTEEINHPNSAFYFAELEEMVLGYLKINTGDAQTEPQGEDSLEIQRIYVLQAFHGQEVGQLLMNKAIEIAKELNKRYVWLGVWEENPRAIRFYEKNGFVIFGSHQFQFGHDLETDIMMKLELKY